MIPRFIAGALAVSAVTALGAAGLAGIATASSAPATVRAAGVAKPYDFNGDGYTDLALGHPYGKVSGYSSAGFVTIVYGSASGPNTAKKKVISQNTTGVPGAAESGDHFGYSLTSFDYDKDGYADLLVGAPDEDTGAGANAGTVTILWGSSAGLSGSGSGAMSEPSDPNDSSPGPDRRFGFSMAAGDSDADGYGDWVVTAPGAARYWSFSSAPAGATATVAGRDFAPSGDSHLVRGEKSGVSAQAGDGSVKSIIPAIGDVNGDGKDDLVLGWDAPSSDDPARTYGFDVWTSDTAAPTAEVLLSAISSLAVGDFDGDGHADVAVGAANETGGVGGNVRVYKGTADTTLSESYKITQDTSGVPGVAVAGDRFGYSLATGDVNKDGKADLAVGVPYRTVSSALKAGEAIMLYGSASGLTGTGAQAVSQSTTGVPGAAEAGDHFGWAVGLPDITNDGYADLAAGAPTENGTDGAVSALKGGSAGVTGTGSVTFGAGTLGVSGLNAQLGVRIGRNG